MTIANGSLGGSIGDTDSISPEMLRARSRMRGILLKGFVATTAVVALGIAIYEWQTPADIVSTDDAYVNVVFAQVTPQIDGIISTVHVHDTQYVHRGDVLIALDPEDAQLDLDVAKSAYEEAFRRAQQDVADTRTAEANVFAKQALVAQAEQQFRRRASVGKAGFVSDEELSNSRSAADAAKYALSMAESELASKRAIAEDAAVESNPQIRSAKTNLEKATLRLERTLIRAPVEGVVAQSRVQIGQQIAAGTELMTIIPMRQLFVDANFKESQITRIRAGQLVTLTSDIYGSSRVFHGHVEGVGGGTGATFAVIPPQNATGNWIKVVQRLPVRIALDPDELADTPVRAGISMTVEVHLDRYISAAQWHRAALGGLARTNLALRSAPSGPY